MNNKLQKVNNTHVKKETVDEFLERILGSIKIDQSIDNRKILSGEDKSIIIHSPQATVNIELNQIKQVLIPSIKAELMEELREKGLFRHMTMEVMEAVNGALDKIKYEGVLRENYKVFIVYYLRKFGDCGRPMGVHRIGKLLGTSNRLPYNVLRKYFPEEFKKKSKDEK